MEPSTLTIAPGESKTVQITLAPTQPGTFSGTITLQHGEQSVGTLEIPFINLTIEAPQLPIISLVQENLSLGEIEVGQEVTTTFTITNSGAGPLTITDIQSNIAGIAFSETSLNSACWPISRHHSDIQPASRRSNYRHHRHNLKRPG